MKVMVLSSFTTSLFWFRIDMMKSFIDAGHEVVAVGDGSEKEWSDKFRELGISYHQIPVQRNGTNPFSDIKTLIALYKLLKAEKPDKIFTYQAKTAIYGGIAARMLGISEIYPLIAGVGSVFLGDGIKNKLICSVLVTEYRQGLKKAKKVFFQNYDDWAVFVGNKIVDANNVEMLNGSSVNIQAFQPAALPEKVSFLCISHLIRDKGVGEYLEAARKIRKLQPEVTCVLAGPYIPIPLRSSPKNCSRISKMAV